MGAVINSVTYSSAHARICRTGWRCNSAPLSKPVPSFSALTLLDSHNKCFTAVSIVAPLQPAHTCPTAMHSMMQFRACSYTAISGCPANHLALADQCKRYKPISRIQQPGISEPAFPVKQSPLQVHAPPSLDIPEDCTLLQLSCLALTMSTCDCLGLLHPLQLKDVTATAKDGRVSQLTHMYIRGSRVRFVIVPDMLKNAPMFKRIDPKHKSKNMPMGVGGRGRAAAVRASRGAEGRGRGEGRGEGRGRGEGGRGRGRGGD